MKKATHHFLIFALLLVAGLAGCGETGQEQTSPPTIPPSAQGQTNEVSPESTAPEIVPPEEFVRISGGTFQMGSPEAEPWRVADETSHTVSLSDFYISRFEVTQKEYEAVMGTNPSSFSGDDLPVECVTWMDAIQYCNTRSVQEGLTPVYTVDGQAISWDRSANGYRLPTEAEWEYACRAGTETPFNTETSISAEEANYWGHYPYLIEDNYFTQSNLETKPGVYRQTTVSVGSFQPNAWGLYDMHGNVGEWVWDWFGRYDTQAQNDPTGPASGTLRVNRGGGWNDFAKNLRSAYRADRPEITINNGQDWTLPEPTADSYDDALMNSAKSFSDTALVVIARCGGEGADLPHDMGAVMDGSYQKGTKYTRATYTNNGSYDDFTAGMTYLELSQTEKDLVELVCSNFDNVIVVYNGSNPLEMGWTEEYEQIRGVLLCASPGATGFNALGKILKGEVNPSGKTVDTWLRDATLGPTYNNIGHFSYDNVEDVTSAAIAAWSGTVDGVVSFVNYVEGVYVGYRYYETAYVEAQENGFDFDYDATVMYPFGYGLSYTTFSQEIVSSDTNGDAVTVDVSVTNTGSTAGKDVVELYYKPPYTNGGIEKAAVNLAAFGKTNVLQPGQSETVKLTFDKEDLASFDTHGAGYYVLEAGEYEVSLRTDAHTVVDTFTFDVASSIVYNESNLHNGDLVVADSKLAFAEGTIEYLSRADGFANYAQATAAPSNYTLDRDTYEISGNGTYDPYQHNNDGDQMPTTGKSNGLELMDLRGKDYDDPMWEDLLDEVTVNEMVQLIAYGGFATVEVPSIKKIATLDSDGPAGVNYSVSGLFGMGYCGEILLAQTWNIDLAYKMGDGICQEFEDFGLDGWYAPSMNLHRSLFAGRNFEYYSEDPLLSGRMAVQECEAAYAHGVYPYIKHFAFNEQETNRNGMLCTWLTEQSARELYLKPFEDCVKANQGQALAVMSSYVYVGTTWDGGCSALLNDILRGEWGYKGLVLTDYFGNYGYMDADKAVRGGSDIMLGTAGNDAILTDQSSATSVRAMRQATKNILYTVVNSSTYSQENYDAAMATPGWIMTTYTVDAILIALLVVAEVIVIRSSLKKKKNG